MLKYILEKRNVYSLSSSKISENRGEFDILVPIWIDLWASLIL